MIAPLSFDKPDREPDFRDCFTGSNAFPDHTPKELASIAVASSPRWFKFLFATRQKIARMLGLLTETPDGGNPGVGFLLSLPVIQDDEEAYEAGLSDKHLDFVLRLAKDQDQVSLETHIWYNNFWGRAYLNAVLPFHNLIVSHWVRTLGRPA